MHSVSLATKERVVSSGLWGSVSLGTLLIAHTIPHDQVGIIVVFIVLVAAIEILVAHRPAAAPAPALSARASWTRGTRPLSLGYILLCLQLLAEPKPTLQTKRCIIEWTRKLFPRRPASASAVTCQRTNWSDTIGSDTPSWSHRSNMALNVIDDAGTRKISVHLREWQWALEPARDFILIAACLSSRQSHEQVHSWPFFKGVLELGVL